MMRGSLRKLIPTLLFLALIKSIVGDPYNLVINGDFEWENFFFEGDRAMDVTTTNIMNYIPFMNVVHGGVQLLNGYMYYPYSLEDAQGGDYLLHMNYKNGPGVLHTSEIATPRKGALYTVQFLIADNPDGGPLVKAIRARTLINNRVAAPQPQIFSVSNPYSSRSSIDWNLMSYTFVGTGDPTKLQFESLSQGKYGPLLDNITVTLQSLVENGSFENVSNSVLVSNFTQVTVIESPSLEIQGWTVKSGKIRYSTTFRVSAATDSSPHVLYLNAEYSAGTISSDPFSTKRGKRYKLLFDTAANPDDMPSFIGRIMASVYSYPRGALLVERSVLVSGEGFSALNAGWTTYELEFLAQEEASVVEFASQAEGGFNGPLLDNIVVFEIFKPGHHTTLASTFSGMAAPYNTSTKTRGFLVTFVLAIWISRHFLFEIILFLHS